MDASGKIAPNKVFWVDSNYEAADKYGTFTRPFSTITAALAVCTANKGDIIYVKAGHASSISAAGSITVSVAGVSIIGLGKGTSRPTLTYSATTSTMIVTADNVKISNLRFVSAINDLAEFLTVTANHCLVENCIFSTANTFEAFCFIGLTTTYDYLTVRGCRFIQPTDPAGTDDAAETGCIFLVDSEYVTIENCQFVGNFETAIIHNRGTAAGQLWVRNCYGYNALSTAQIYTLVEGATGGDIGGLYTNPNATDVTTAQLFGSASTKFFVASYFGNDSGGGQGAVKITIGS